jgi:hypothetical protein
MLAMGERKTFSAKRASEGLTCSFKSISRNKNAAWGNRFVRDHNDLLYDANPESISNKLKQSAKPKKKQSEQEEDSSPIKKYEYSPFKQRCT